MNILSQALDMGKRSANQAYTTVSSDEIPLGLMQEFPRYTVTLVGVQEKSRGRHCGVGTLVSFRGTYYILTAAHCAEVLDRFVEMALPLRQGYFVTLPIVRAYITDRTSDEWGPDLALLRVPSVKADDIRAVSNRFYDLERHADEMLSTEPPIDHGLWVVVGTPADLSKIDDESNLQLAKMTYLVAVTKPTERQAFDYIHARADTRLSHVPASFKGLSGGGLWRLDLGRTADGTLISVGVPKLEGCVFYQTAPDGNYVYIRCHGRKSIYGRVLSTLIDPKIGE